MQYALCTNLMASAGATATAAVRAAAVRAAATTAGAGAAATAATAGETVYLVLDIFVGGLATLYDGADEVEVATSEWVVEIYLHLIVGDSEDARWEATALSVLERDDSTLEDGVGIELSIEGEDALVELEHCLLHIVAVCLVLGDGEVKLLSLLEGEDILLEAWDGGAEA